LVVLTTDKISPRQAFLRTTNRIGPTFTTTHVRANQCPPYIM